MILSIMITNVNYYITGLILNHSEQCIEIISKQGQ